MAAGGTVVGLAGSAAETLSAFVAVDDEALSVFVGTLGVVTGPPHDTVADPLVSCGPFVVVLLTGTSGTPAGGPRGTLTENRAGFGCDCCCAAMKKIKIEHEFSWKILINRNWRKIKTKKRQKLYSKTTLKKWPRHQNRLQKKTPPPPCQWQTIDVSEFWKKIKTNHGHHSVNTQDYTKKEISNHKERRKWRKNPQKHFKKNQKKEKNPWKKIH